MVFFKEWGIVLIKIRQVISADREILKRFVSNMIGDINCEEVAAEVVEDFYSHEQYYVLVVEEQDVQGFAVLKFEPFEGANGVAEIVWLGVGQQYRRHHVGTNLIKQIEDYATAKGVRKVYIKTSPGNKIAVCFWIIQGYRFEARLLDFGGKGFDNYLLGKDLF